MLMPTMIIDHDDGQYLPERLIADLVYVCEIDDKPMSVTSGARAVTIVA